MQIQGQISSEASRLLRRYRLSHGLLMPDAIIAATAIVLGAALVTKNQRDFRHIDELRLVKYP